MSFSCNCNHICLHLEKKNQEWVNEYRQTAGKNPVFTSCRMWADRMAQVNGNAALNFIQINRYVLKENESIDLAVYRPFLCHCFLI